LLRQQNRPAFAGRLCFDYKTVLHLQGDFVLVTKPSRICREALFWLQNRPEFAGRLCFDYKTVQNLQGGFVLITKPSRICREALF
jgi:hypothetical protein